MKKVYVENANQEIGGMFMAHGWTRVNSVFHADLVCLDGGADVSPSLYNEYNTDSVSDENTDIHTFGLLHIAHNILRIPVVGICRGSQALNVFLGGSMIQHVDGHCKVHNIQFRGENYEVQCGHHQAAVLPSHLFPECSYADDGVLEVALYYDKKLLGFQPHPEWTEEGSESQELFFKLVGEICRDGV